MTCASGACGRNDFPAQARAPVTADPPESLPIGHFCTLQLRGVGLGGPRHDRQQGPSAKRCADAQKPVLQCLELGDCEPLAALPQSLSALSELQQLALDGYSSLVAVPQRLDTLTAQ